MGGPHPASTLPSHSLGWRSSVQAALPSERRVPTSQDPTVRPAHQRDQGQCTGGQQGLTTQEMQSEGREPKIWQQLGRPGLSPEWLLDWRAFCSPLRPGVGLLWRRGKHVWSTNILRCPSTKRQRGHSSYPGHSRTSARPPTRRSGREGPVPRAEQPRGDSSPEWETLSERFAQRPAAGRGSVPVETLVTWPACPVLRAPATECPESRLLPPAQPHRRDPMTP